MSEERTVRAALTQTVNVYPLPALERIDEIGDQLEALRAANVKHHIGLAAKAKEAGAQLVCFGELFTGPYFALTQDPVWRDLAEDAREGPTAREIQAAARELELVLIAPIYELDPATGRRFNTALVVDSTGELLGCYRKTHIPHGENEQGVFAEGFYYEQSDGQAWAGEKNVSRNPYFPVFQTRLGKVGVAICYDRHFEGVLSALARNGAELILCPAVTFGQKSRRMWKLEFPVDACRHRVFVGGSNRYGSELPWGQGFFGGGYFCDPNGERLADLTIHEQLVISDLNLGSLREPDPAGWNLPRDTRSEIYRADAE